MCLKFQLRFHCNEKINIPLISGSFKISLFLLMLKLEEPCLFSFRIKLAGPENFDLFTGTTGTGGGALFPFDLIEA